MEQRNKNCCKIKLPDGFVSQDGLTEKSADALYQESLPAASPIPALKPESMFRQFNANAELSRPTPPRNSLLGSPLVIGLSAIGAFLCSVLLFENSESIASLFRRSHDVASARMDAGAGKVDHTILQLNGVPKVKIGEKLGPPSNNDLPDKWARLDPISPGASAPNTQAGEPDSLTLASNDLVPGNLSPDVPNTVPTTGFPGPGVDGLTQQLLNALPSPLQTVATTVTTQPEHIVRVIRETVIVRTVTKSAKATANNAGQVVKGVTKSGNLVQTGAGTVRSTAAMAGASVIRTGLGAQTFGSGSSGGSLGSVGAGGAGNALSGAGGGFSGAIGGAAGGLDGAGGSLGGLGGSVGGTVGGALGGVSNAVGGLGGGHH
jgi:hypothetical protein